MLDLPDVPGRKRFVAGAEWWRQRVRDEYEKSGVKEG